MTRIRRSVSASVRLEVGSSMMTRRASSDSALTISTQLALGQRQFGDRRVGLEVDAQAVEQRLARGA